ncbi:ABC transporter ATP-binding protein [Treponema parvum]|uniref:ABC transporter ATP-binding protein n=1 Tax=Treponema parvum TaxID=138851 RepID=UPI001AEBC3A9|nr:ATP-binding cassette domain-containing protein [Treponema parvum]QTQ15621.1 ATP-binding cassette domain-containing protein [Treponema parvum]
MIEVSHVSRIFGDFCAVNDVSFSIPTGEIVGLLGPNGAGKTTTMRMITGFLEMSSGSIKIDGKDIREDPVRAKRKIGYMPEAAPLYGDMITEDYLRYVAEIQGADADKKVPVLCDICGLKEVMHKNINELSRGYRQRVGLAHALMNDPEILILDEPTSGLDPNQIGDVRKLIKEIGKTRTVIISTHILSEVEMICNRIIIISQGQLVADSPATELRERYGHSLNIKITVGKSTENEFVKACGSLSGVAGITVLQQEGQSEIEGNKTVSALVSVSGGKEIRSEIFELCVKNKWILYEMTPQYNSLEDVFKTLTTSDNSGETADHKTKNTGTETKRRKKSDTAAIKNSGEGV